MRPFHRTMHFLFEGLLFSAGLLALGGCGSALTPTTSNAAAITLTGNWQLASSSPVASQLPALSGELTGTTAGVTGLFHSDSASACVPPSSVAVLSGSTNAEGVLSLAGSLAGGSLIITGTPAADGKSLTNATYAISGGACAFASPAYASAQAIGIVGGTYAGNFTDVYGNSIPISTVLSQSSPDANGNFVLSGYANLPANGCFSSPTNTDSAQVSGQNFTITYADGVTGNSLTTSGTVSTDGTILTTSAWTVTGPCAGENGTGGTLTKQ